MKILRQPCSCRPGIQAHAARDGIRAFAIGYHIFYESAESVFLSRCRESGRGKIRSLYTEILDSFLSKLHFGRNYRDIHDRWEIEFFHGKRPHFSLQPFILHKLLLFTLTSPKPGRQQTEAKAKQKQKSNKEEQSQDFPH